MEVDIEDTTHESVAEQSKINTPNHKISKIKWFIVFLSRKYIQNKADAPTVLIAMGMAGSGKTTFVHVSL